MSMAFIKTYVFAYPGQNGKALICMTQREKKGRLLSVKAGLNVEVYSP